MSNKLLVSGQPFLEISQSLDVAEGRGRVEMKYER
jgi:hypothetical protein